MILAGACNPLSPNDVIHMKVINRYAMVHGSFSDALVLGLSDGNYVPC